MLTKNKSKKRSQTFYEQSIAYTIQGANLTKQEEWSLKNSLATQLIVKIAECSGCSDPLRIAVANLTTLIAAKRTPQLYGHQPGESLAQRLLPVQFYPGGNQAVIHAGMLLLELLSLKDHKADIIDDMLEGKQNPLIVDMSYRCEMERIISGYNKIPSQVRDQFSEITDILADASWWI